jgi:hypothetical protein
VHGALRLNSCIAPHAVCATGKSTTYSCFPSSGAAVEFPPETMLSLGFGACGGGGRGIGVGRGWWGAGGPVHCRNCTGGRAR